ncbi:MAG TPA: hypothetical protein VHE35_11380, partial [Kofleriaceae bacterium]|nr:hypothetical protein [Kofleriaceae bacterium]
MDVARHCEVAVALPVAGLFTYRVPPVMAGAIGVGARVLVPFAGRKVPGVVTLAPAPPPATAIELADVAAVGGARVPPELVALALWVADYYEAPPGEALRLVVPAGTSGATTTVIRLTERGHAALAGEGAVLAPRQQ